jgi:hypothetical protein
MNSRRTLLGLVAFAILLAGSGLAWSVVRARSQDRSDRQEREEASKDWEYLIVAGGNVMLGPGLGSEPGRKKQNEFNREAVTVERNLDRLGAQGWELIHVGGPPNDPFFYMKRVKREGREGRER